MEETKPKRQPRELTEKQLEAKRLRQEIRQQEIDERDELKAEEKRQKDELAKKKSEIASARLKYLLSQSDIFAHFSGQVKNKKGKKGAALDADADAETGDGRARRRARSAPTTRKTRWTRPTTWACGSPSSRP